MLRGACTLSEYFCLPQERTYKSAHQIPSDRHLIFSVPILESDCPWSWNPGHSRELAHGRVGGGILFPSVHGLQRPNRADRHPPGICQPSCNVVLSCRLDFTGRLLATSRSGCE